MDDNMYNLNMMPISVRGLNVRIKTRKIFTWIKKQQNGNLLLHEAHSTADQQKIWRSEWGGTILFSHWTNRARGVAILIKPGFNVAITDVHQDSSGCLIIVDAKLQDTPFKLVNTWKTNTTDSPLALAEKYEKRDESKEMWNVTLETTTTW